MKNKHDYGNYQTVHGENKSRGLFFIVLRLQICDSAHKAKKICYYIIKVCSGLFVWFFLKIIHKQTIDNAVPYCNEESFLDDLRDALKVYGAFEDESDLNKKCNTIVDF